MREIRLDRVPGWRQVKKGFAETRRSARLHRELMGLSDRYLQDIGYSRAADVCHSKPFWYTDYEIKRR